MIRSVFLLILPFLFTIIYGQNTINIDRLDNAVGVVICYDIKGNKIGHGSCFVIDPDGILVTNYHVLKDVYLAKVKLESGLYNLNQIIAGSEEIDLVKFSINKKYTNQKFPYLKINYNLPRKGQVSWAIGTPFDISLMNTVSKGIISNVHKDKSPLKIQTTAEITNGSSGGALLNSSGEVIGVTTSGFKKEAANLNFAIWIGEIKKLKYVYKKRIYNDALIPVQVSFYIRYISNSNDVSLYIDNRYVGTFKSYFKKPIIPICGQDGTISTYLSKGYHSWYAYERSSGSRWSGNFTISSNTCFSQGLSNTPTIKKPTYISKYPNVTIRTKKEDKGFFDMKFSFFVSGSTPYSSNKFDGGPIYAFGLDKEINYNTSVQLKYQNLPIYNSPNYEGSDIEGSYDFNSFFLDFKFYDDDNDEPSMWFGPSIALISLKKTEVNTNTLIITKLYDIKHGIGFGVRAGFDGYITKHIIWSWDLVLMRCSKDVIDRAKNWGIDRKPEEASLNFNLGLGYRL